MGDQKSKKRQFRCPRCEEEYYGAMPEKGYFTCWSGCGMVLCGETLIKDARYSQKKGFSLDDLITWHFFLKEGF